MPSTSTALLDVLILLTAAVLGVGLVRRLRGHVIVCGYGRTGRRVGEFLREEGIPFVAVDADEDAVAAETLVQLGVPMESALSRVRALRTERYAKLREFYDERAE